MNIKGKKFLNTSLKKFYNNKLYHSKSISLLRTYSPKLRPRSSSLKEFSKNIFGPKIDCIMFTEEEIKLLFEKKCEDIDVNIRLELFDRFNDFISKRCVNRIIDLSECNLSINSIKALKYILKHSKNKKKEDKCSRLILGKNNIGDKGVEILSDFLKENKSIVYLDLSSNDIGIKGADLLFKILINNISIISLNLSSLDGINRNRICSEGCKFLTTLLKENKFLNELNLSGNSIKNEGLKYIIDGLNNNFSLSILMLGNNEIDEKGISNFNLIKKCNLMQIDLKENSIKNIGLKILGKCMTSSLMTLKKLNISSCKITFEGVKKFFSLIFQNRTINSITLNNNYLGGGKFEDLEPYISNMNLRYLGLSSCSIGKSFIQLASLIISNNTLKGIDLSYNQIDDECFNHFIKLPRNNRMLKSLDLSKNFISGNSAKVFFNNLSFNNSLKYINFHDNQMQNSVANSIINSLRINKSVLKINLNANRVQLKMINEINKFLKRNATIEHERLVPSLKDNIKRLQFNPKELTNIKKKIIVNSNDRNILYQKVIDDSKKFAKQKEINDKNLKELDEKNNKYIQEMEIYNTEIKKIEIEIENTKEQFNKESNVIEKKINALIKDINIIKNNNSNLIIERDLMKKELEENISKYENDLKNMISKVNLALKNKETITNDLQEKKNTYYSPKKSEKTEDKKGKVSKKTSTLKVMKIKNEKENEKEKEKEKEKKENKKSRPASTKKKKIWKSSSTSNLKVKIKKKEK